jgi:hypothetical protein
MASNPSSSSVGHGHMSQESGESPINLAHFSYPIKQEGGMMQDAMGNGYLNSIPISSSGLSVQQPMPQGPGQTNSTKKEKSKKSVDNTTKKKKTR